MEKQIYNKEPKNNIFLNLLFLKSFQLYIKGRRRNIEVEELCSLWPYSDSKKLGENLEERWNYFKNKTDEVSITQVLWSCFGKTYILYGIFQAFFQIAVILFAQPFLVGKIVSFFTPQQKELSKHDAFCYVYILIFILIIKALYGSNYTLLMARFGIKIRTALCSFLFRKILKLNSTHSDDLSTGKVLTLITKDVQSLENFVLIGNHLWICVVKVFIICCILYAKVGLSCFVGVGCFLLVMPLQIYFGGKVKEMKINMSRESDQRLQTLQETMSGIRLIKMYTLEKFFSAKIYTCRKKEMKAALKMFIVRFVILTMGTLNSELALYLTLMSFIAVGNNISGEIIYFLALVSRQLIYLFGTEFPDVIYRASEALAAVRRLNTSLHKIELVQYNTNKITINSPKVSAKNITLTIQKKVVLKNVTIKLRTGLTIISGPVGSGKSIFLKTLLNEYSIDEGNLTVEGSISYASQEPWLFPGTIKKNILFGEEDDVNRYKEVLRVCALVYDLHLMKDGDETIIEDRGANLSKGQQARINLARAVYRQRDIYLLDAPLAGLDAHVAAYIFEECLKKFLKNTIVVLVTHNLKFSTEGIDFVYFENGSVSSSPKDLKANKSSKEEKKKSEEEHVCNEEETNESATLVVKKKTVHGEQAKSGNVKYATYKKYAGFGGGVPALMFVFLSQGGVVLVFSFKDVFISNWVNLEEKLVSSFNSTEHEITQEHTKVFYVYSSLIVLLLVTATLRSTAVLLFAKRASIRIHKQMIDQITRASTAFFDNNSIGNIMNRFSTDLTTVDEVLPFLLARAFRVTCLLIGSIVVVALVNQQFLIPTAALFILIILCRCYTIKTSTTLKRLDTISKSPVIGHISATLDGLTTIRALKAEETVRRDFDYHQNVYASTSCAFQSTGKAFILFLDALAALFNTVIITKCFVFVDEITAGDVGLAISNAFLITGGLHLTVSAWTELENQMTSTERTLEYTQIKEENSGGVEIENWPSHGKIIFENVSLEYSETHTAVLNNINLRIKPGEKVGVVGRTGAGKTSLISSLFRMYDTVGKITIDDVDIKTVSSSFLRSHISVIAQEPFLFSATIRENIDPLKQFSDEEIWRAVEKVDLKKHITSLDLQIGAKDVNLSVGEKQLLCIARAILQKNKILVLDEITASSDVETEKTIYQAIEENFSDCTIITIAHRLKTVLRSDRIVVLEKGTVLECDLPAVLMADRNSVFGKMVAKAGLLSNRNK